MEKNNDLFGGRSEAERMKNVANQVHDIVNAIPEIPQLETSDDEVQVETTESPEENPVVSAVGKAIANHKPRGLFMQGVTTDDSPKL